MASLLGVTCANGNAILKVISLFTNLNVRFLRSPRSSVVTVRKSEINKNSKTSNLNKLKNEAICKEKTETSILKGKAKKKYKIPVTIENQYSRLAETVTPLWKVPYEEQLKIKYKGCEKKLKQLAFLMRDKKCKNIPPSGLPCPLKRVIPSPVINNYRNKDEFSIRHGLNGHSKTLGYFIGSPAEYENVICVGPDQLINIKNSHKKVVQYFQNYINNSSLDACIDLKHGHWKNLIVRSNIHEELMAIVVMHPQNLSQEDLKIEKEKLQSYFSVGEGKECNLKSLYFQACPHTRCTHQQAPFELIFGDPYIIEEIDDFKFRISPESFFQINTAAAKLLFEEIIELANLNSDSTLIDICCGTGAIGLFAANNIKRTIGIESTTQAVEDAFANAELNEIKNSTFFKQTVETFLPSLLSELYTEDMVVVLNPARAGLKNSVIKTLRECKHLKRVIYVSCKPEGKAMDNIIQLCNPPKKFETSTQPFVLTLAVPIDLFPHTRHCELVMVLQRL